MDKQGKFAQDSPDFVGGKKPQGALDSNGVEIGAKCREYTTPEQLLVHGVER